MVYNPYPSWLPNEVYLENTWATDVPMLFAIYDKDFIKHQCEHKGVDVVVDNRVLEHQNYPETFLHIITRNQIQGDKESPRVFEPCRAKRLIWCRPMIENWTGDGLKCFRYEEANGRVQVYIWLERNDFAIVLLELFSTNHQTLYLKFVTAFCLDYNSDRRRMRTRYHNRIQ